MSAKQNWKKTRMMILAAAPVAASIIAPNSGIGATQTWSGDHSNFIGTTTNWVTAPAGSNSVTTNTDLAVLPDFLTGAGGNPGDIYLATTSNQNTMYSLGTFELTDLAGANVSQYNITNNNDTAGSGTVSLYLNGTTVNSATNTILANTTTGMATILEVGNDLGTKTDALPVALVLPNTTNNIFAAPSDQVVIGSGIVQTTAGTSIAMAGGGSLQLSGANTFSGGVTVNSSTLVAGYTGGASSSQSSTGTSASNVTLNSSTLASLVGKTSYIAGNVALGTGSNIIAPGGNGTGAIGTLDIAGSLAFNGSTTLDIDLAANSGDQLNLGSLTVTGTPTINIDSDNGPSGNFVVATYATNNSLTNSSFNFTNTPSGYAWDVTSTEIELIQQQPPANVTWNATPVSGSVSGTWDTTSHEWTGGTPVATLYKSGDTANFNDIPSGTSGTISIVSGGVTPFSTTINNANTAYSFTDADGANGIGGAGSVTKTGTGTATFEAPNSYTGGTFLNGGLLIADGDTTLGSSSSPIVFAGGTLQAGAAIGSTGTPSTRAITVNTGGGTFNTNGLNSVNNGAVNINDVFNVNGSGGLELDGPVNFTATGALNIGTGATVTLGGTAASDTITQINPSVYNGNLVVTNTARINFNTASTDGSPSVFSGTGQIDITNGGTTEVSTVSGTPNIVYTTYDTGVTITNLKSTAGTSTAGGVVDVPIVLNSTNQPFTKADVTQPDASFVPGNFTVSIGGTTAGDGLTINGVISGNSDVNIANGPGGGGAGSLTLGAQNTYTGTTLINGSGTLQLAVPDALPTTSDVIFATINAGVGANTTVDLDGNLQQWNSLSAGQFRHHADENITNNSDNPATLLISGSTTPADPFDGVIADGNGIVSLEKAGTNTLTLTGTSTFSGGTTLNGGTISISNDDNLGAFFGALTFGGGTLAVTGGAPVASARPVTVNSGGGTIDVASGTSYTLTGSPSLAWDGNLTFTDTGTAALAQTAGTVSVTPGSTLTVNPGATLAVTGPVDPFTDSTVSTNHVAVVNNGNLSVAEVNSSIASINGTGTLTVGDGVNRNTLQIAPGSNSLGNSQNALSILGNSTLDITNNILFINYGSPANDPIASIEAMIKSGYNGGTWTGDGITSSTAAVNSGSYGIGYADSADPGNPANLSSGQIEIRYTLLGDANLDGKVNGADFTILASNFNQGGKSWDQGDFNYDGNVNGADFTLLASNFNQSATQSAVGADDLAALDAFAAANGISLTSVPEPASIGLLAAGAVGLMARRRRR